MTPLDREILVQPQSQPGIQCAEYSVGSLDLRQHGRRDPENLQQLGIPAQRREVEQLSPAGIGVIGGMDLAAGEAPDQPAVKSAGQQIAARSPLAGSGDVVRAAS